MYITEKMLARNFHMYMDQSASYRDRLATLKERDDYDSDGSEPTMIKKAIQMVKVNIEISSNEMEEFQKKSQTRKARRCYDSGK